MSERLSDEPLEPEFDPGLPRRRSEHGGMPRRDDDEFALAAERDRVAAGLEDYAPDARGRPSAARSFRSSRFGGARAVGRHLNRHAGPLTAQCCGFDGCDGKRTPPGAGWWRLLSHGSAWLSVECVSAEGAVVTSPYGLPPISRQTIGIVAARPGRRTTLWIAAVLTIICLPR
jgi:hypothetical protein